METLVCTECGSEWSVKRDEDGLVNGYGCPPCPNCGFGRGVPANDYGDFKCNTCGNLFRRYGNGGLRLGRIPRCPDGNGYCSEI